jgi:hypothetical protein
MHVPRVLALGQRRDAEQIGHRLAGFPQFDPVLVGIAAFVVSSVRGWRTLSRRVAGRQ